MNEGIFYAIAFSIFIVPVGAGGYTLRFCIRGYRKARESNAFASYFYGLGAVALSLGIAYIVFVYIFMLIIGPFH